MVWLLHSRRGKAFAFTGQLSSCGARERRCESEGEGGGLYQRAVYNCSAFKADKQPTRGSTYP
jgi:hypothetical protein